MSQHAINVSDVKMLHTENDHCKIVLKPEVAKKLADLLGIKGATDIHLVVFKGEQAPSAEEPQAPPAEEPQAPDATPSQ